MLHRVTRPLLPLLAWLLLTGADRAPLDVRAERVELSHKQGVVRFEGSVVATQEDLELRCTKVTVRYREDGEIDELVAEGDVRVAAEGLRATARRAIYKRTAGILELTGDPEVQRGADRLRGARIVFWPDEGRMVIEQARGTLSAPRLSGLTGAPR